MAKAPKLSYGKLDLLGLRKAAVKFNKTFYKESQVLFNDGARTFVHVTVQFIHVDTGMAAGTLQPLAQKLGTGILSDIRGRIKRPGRLGYTTMTGRYYRSGIRTLSEGIKAGMSAYSLNYGSQKRPRMIMTFKTNVYQYALWEPINWHSLEFGLEAMRDYILMNFSRRFPSGDLARALNPRYKVG